MQPGRARTSGLGVPPLLLARWVGWVAPVRPTQGVLFLSCPSAALGVCGVLGHLAPVHGCARSVRCFACAVSWATCLLFTGVPAQCVVLRVRCPGPLGSCSPLCPLRALLCVWCPGPLGSCSPVCPLSLLCCVCGVLGHLAPVHQCARPVCFVACAVSWATWLLSTVVPPRRVVLRVRCPGPLGSCSPVCPLDVLCCLGHTAPVHQCACSVRCLGGAVSWATWLLFTVVPARLVVLRVRCPGPLGSCSPVRLLGALLCVCGVLGHLAAVHRSAHSVCRVACAVFWATWLLFTGVPARAVVLCVRCSGPLSSGSPLCPLGLLCCVCGVLALGSCSPVRLLGALLCVCGVLGHLASVHRCARSVCRVACAVSWATWLLFTVVPARAVVLCVRCPGPLGSSSLVCPLSLLCCVCGVLGLGSCSPVCLLGALLCVCGFLGHLASVHRCARSVCRVACAVFWATWLLFTCVPARAVVLCVRCPGPLGSCSPVCLLGVLCCVCGVLGHLAPVHWCGRSLCCVVRAVSWAPRLLFTGVPARRVVLRVRCPGPLGSCSLVWPLIVLCCVCSVLGLGSCSTVRPLGALLCVCGVLGHLAPVHRCACLVRCCACAVSWATWLLFTGVPTRCVVLRVRCSGPLGSCSPVCPLGLLCCVCGVLGPSAPLHRCARSACCVACAVFWALAPVHQCACLVRCCACAVSWATWLLFTGVPARCVVLRVRCPGPLGSCSPSCPLGLLCCVCGVLGPSAPVHQCARSACCVACAVSSALAPVHQCACLVRCCACAVSWATWLLFTGVPARCVVLRVRCSGPLGSCSPVCPLGLLCCACGVLGPSAPVHRCACSACCVACAVSWATWLLFTGVAAHCVVLRVRCPGPLDSCSPVCPLSLLCCVCSVLGLGSCSTVRPLGALLCVCGVLGHLAPVHRCVRSVCCVACAVSWATWLLFTGAPAWCVAVRVRCPWPLGSCSPVCPLRVSCCVCGVLGHLAPVHRCARSGCCVVCAVSSAPRLQFTGVPAWRIVLRVRCPGPLGSCSPVWPLVVLCCACGVLGHLTPVHQCACSVRCFACAVSWATSLLFTGVPSRLAVLRMRFSEPSLRFNGAPAWCVAVRVRCTGPLGSCSPVCPLGVLC